MTSNIRYSENNDYLKWESYYHKIYRDELEYIRQRRQKGDKDTTEIASSTTPLPADKIDEKKDVLPTTDTNFVGLCLSGGGIRSATFSLGFIQALYQYKILHRVDYLSTVSGGGYIGSCLTSLLNSPVDKSFDPDAYFLWEEENFPFAKPDLRDEDESKKTNTASAEKISAEKPAVRHLRYYSNYLTPIGDIFDKYFAPFLIVTRGMFFNFLILFPVILLFGLLLTVFYKLPSPTVMGNHLLLNIDVFTESLIERREVTEDFEYFILQHTSEFGNITEEEKYLLVKKDPLLSHTFSQKLHEMDNAEIAVRSHLWSIVVIPATAFLVMIVSAIFYFFLAKIDQAKAGDKDTSARYSSISRITSSFTTQTELGNRYRFNRIFSFFAVFSVAFLAVELFGAALIFWGHYDVPNKIAFVSLLTFLAPKLLQGGKPQVVSEKKWGKISGTLILFTLTPLILLYTTGLFINLIRGESGFISDSIHWLNYPAGIFICFISLYIVSFRFNINKISLHNFYRDRLCRAYIFQGSNREPQVGGVFHTVENKDELKLSTLYNSNYNTGPYHIINANLNLKKKLPDGNDNGGVFRKGESFIFSKYWCGSEKTGYRSTTAYEKADPHLDLGSAMAISGAAVNIGMGEGDMPAFRLLMGLLNIRLGYWAPNPNPKNCKDSPWHGKTIPAACCALNEWTGNYALNYKFINLTDGGHFDNIGVYELLRRRCKYIIVADAEADPDMEFQALSYLLRLARIDFGIEIKIDISGLVRDEKSKFSAQHCAVGIIQYPKYGDQPEEEGYLLYCKSTLTGDEPAHLYEYHVKNPDFPHETTADQWFKEQQFEAYRELGYHIGKSVLTFSDAIKDSTPMEEIFNQLKEFWYPQSLANKKFFTHHSSELSNIFNQIKSNPDLKFMDSQIYPEWHELMDDTRNKAKELIVALPETDAEKRAGFYTCNQMIQLMENVYTDLRLEEYYNHPDNRGWLNLFTIWSWSSMLRVTWAICACTYGAKFQKFCERRLELCESDVQVDNLGTFTKEDLINQESRHKLKFSLNPYEQKILSDFIVLPSSAPRSLYAFQIRVTNPVSNDDYINFCFGFALVMIDSKAKKMEIEYFRIQDHLRRMGLGRKAMQHCVIKLLQENDPDFEQTEELSVSNLQYLAGISLKDIDVSFKRKYSCNQKKVRQILDSVCTEIETALLKEEEYL